MNVNFCNKQQPKAVALSAKVNSPPSDQSKGSERFLKEEKKKVYQKKCDKQENRKDSTPTTGNNAEPSVSIKRKDSGQIICYNYNKKDHISKDYTEPKKAKN